jgi:alkylation response protein AidB-like acyl-CoA dehydrogenase
LNEQATRLDAGEKDLQVEGSIAKYFATEAGNKAAEDAIQGLGGYGYISEYEVEKIKRDVKITCIYEGTSEIQQNIISTFRWRTTVRSKGEYYRNMAQEMQTTHESTPDIGAATCAWAANVLNETILFVHENRLTKQQYVMFCLADMMTYVEVGISLARKTKQLLQEGSSQATKYTIMSRIFANEVVSLIALSAIKIVTGSGMDSDKIPSSLKEKLGYEGIIPSYGGLIQDMDVLADIVFNRA